MTIADFRGPHRWLSNFYLADVVFEGHRYPSTEHAFQAAKTLDIQQRIPFMTGVQAVELGSECFQLMTCAEAKRAGRKLPLRPDWEKVQLDVMWACLADKFTRHAALTEKLLATGNEELIEGNTWGDTYWGVCGGVGENHLGKLLMELRKALRQNA